MTPRPASLDGNTPEDTPPPPLTSRRGAELSLVRSFVETVMQTGRDLMEEKKRQREMQLTERHGLTDAEKRILQKQAYYNWTAGLTAGTVTFGVLFGGTFFWMSRRRRSSPHRLLTVNATKQAQRSPQDYTALDRPPRLQKSRTVSKESTMPSSAALEQATSTNNDENWWQVPFVCCGAVAAIVSISTASFLFDGPKFHRQLATVPLQPGQSYFCARMCPALIQQRNQILQEDEKKTALWNDPETVELEAIVQLIHNCRLRMDYQDAVRRQQPSENDSGDKEKEVNDEPVEVPEPGVPLQYEY